MRIPVVSAAAICSAAAILLVATSADSRAREDRDLLRAETARLRAHFDSVLAELRARDVSGLRPSQRAARSRLVHRLEAYRDAGVFPHNHDFPGERVPYFRDEHGTLCAMAYLVASTGRTDLVDDVARERNNAYVPALAGDRRLVIWLDSVGLTVAEAARIQPQYDGPPLPGVVENPERARYVVPSIVLGVPALWSAVLNWRAPREKGADASMWIGALSGAATAMLGVAILAEESDETLTAVGLADVTAGTAALAAVVRRSLRRTPAAPPRPPVASEASRLSLDVAPVPHRGHLRTTARLRVSF